MKTVIKTKINNDILPLLSQRKQRSLVWKKLAGIWKKRNPPPLEELRAMRRDWAKRG